jgi:hypothetical protein
MASPSLEPDYGASLGGLGALARQSLPVPRPETDLRQRQSYEIVRAKLAVVPKRTRGAGLLLPLSVIGALALGAVALVGSLPHDPPLVAVVAGAPLREGTAVEAPVDAEANIRFSDGTQVRLERASRTRIASYSPKGARLRLEDGRAKVRVVPRKKGDGDWRFHAGPCEVQVTGTSFDMNWSEPAQRLEVELYTGSVTVRGPAVPSVVTLKAGERLVMDVRRGRSVVSRIGAVADAPRPQTATFERLADAAPAEAPTAAHAAPVAVRAPRPDRNAPALRELREPRRAASWSALARDSEFAAILEDARRQGIDATLSRGGSADLLALADAARLTGETTLARRTLLAVRARFPESGQAHKAAFLLGRMAEESEGDLGKSLEWYGLYLAQAPRGPLAAEALGRRMTATMRLYGQASARPFAEEYLRRFSNGAYADAARALVKSTRR